MVSGALPPITADESDRAVVNAPVILLTAPISGELERISLLPGDTVDAGTGVAKITNSRIDRTTLLTLEEKATAVRESIEAARQKRESDLRYIASLDDEIAKQSAQIALQMESQIAEVRANIAGAEAGLSEKKAIVDRQAGMVARNIASTDMLKPTTQQYQSALSKREAEKAKLQQKQRQLEALKSGVYVGDDLATLAAMAQKRRDLELDAQRLEIEERELTAGVEDRNKLIEAERKRLDRLGAARLTAPTTGEVFAVDAAAGRFVNSGDTVATLVRCDRSFVVAIFSYRQAQSLTVGTNVSISGADFTQGTVAAVLPKTSDKLDERYAVPFPQTERRELYVLIEPNRSESSSFAERFGRSSSTACNVGQWVTVHRSGGWVPSMSLVWRRLENVVTTAFYTTTPAAAESTNRGG
jgi:multidrug resistance efflux pump